MGLSQLPRLIEGFVLCLFTVKHVNSFGSSVTSGRIMLLSSQVDILTTDPHGVKHFHVLSLNLLNVSFVSKVILLWWEHYLCKHGCQIPEYTEHSLAPG